MNDMDIRVKEKFLSKVNKIEDENDRKDFTAIVNNIFNYIYLENKDTSVDEIVTNANEVLFLSIMNVTVERFEELTNKYKYLAYILNTVVIPIFAQEVDIFLEN